MFAVINVETGQEMLRFDTPQEAVQASKEINDSHRLRGSEFRTKIQKVETVRSEDEILMRLQSARFFVEDDDGRDWAPWRRETWWRAMQDKLQHVAHGKFTDPERVRFYSDTDGLFDSKRKTLSVGAYLNRYALDSVGERIFNDDEVTEMALLWSNHFAARTLHVVKDGDEIADVYERGPRSCMSFAGGGYEGPVHPCKVYGAGDLGLAYFTDTDEPDGRPKARALVWPEHKVHGRIYGDCSRMARLLDEAGYSEGSLDGARVEKIEYESGYVMPYIDGSYAVNDCGAYFEIADCGDVSADGVDGVSYDRRQQCTHCGGEADDDDMTVAYDDNEPYCCDCAQWCGHCGEAHSPDYPFHQIQDIGENVCEDCAQQNYTECEACCEYHEDHVCTEQGSTYCNDCAAEYVCSECSTCDEDVSLDDDSLCPACREERDADEADEDEDDDDNDDESEDDDA